MFRCSKKVQRFRCSEKSSDVGNPKPLNPELLNAELLVKYVKFNK